MVRGEAKEGVHFYFLSGLEGKWSVRNFLKVTFLWIKSAQLGG